MALRTPLSVTPHLYMGDSTGRPLDMGTVYFGEQDKDPEFYPIELFSDDELTKPLMQPVHTKGGYLYDKGDMVEPHAKEFIYSVKVLDSYGRKVFYKGAMMRNSWNDDVIQQINAAIIASTEIAKKVATDITNEAINNTAVEGGVLADTLVTVTANGAGAVARTQRDKNSDVVHVRDFGAVTENLNVDSGDAIQAAIDYVAAKGGGVVNLSGRYMTTKTLIMKSKVALQGEKIGRATYNMYAGATIRKTTAGPIISSGTDTAAVSYYAWAIRDLLLDGNNVVSTSVEIHGAVHCVIDNVMSMNHIDVGFNFTSRTFQISYCEFTRIGAKGGKKGVIIDYDNSIPTNYNNGNKYGFSIIVGQSDCCLDYAKGGSNTLECYGGEVTSIVGGNTINMRGGFAQLYGDWWSEPRGGGKSIYATGGTLMIIGSGRFLGDITQEGGLVIFDQPIGVHQLPIMPSLSREGIKHAYSFRDGSLKDCIGNTDLIVSGSLEFNKVNSRFGSSVRTTGISPSSFALKSDTVDWTKDWTLGVCAKTTSTGELSMRMFKDGSGSFNFSSGANSSYIKGSRVIEGVTVTDFSLSVTKRLGSEFQWIFIKYDSTAKTLSSSRGLGGEGDSVWVGDHPIDLDFLTSDGATLVFGLGGSYRLADFDEIFVAQRHITANEVMAINNSAVDLESMLGTQSPLVTPDVITKGTTANRPSTPTLGMRYYDTTLLPAGKPIEWNGTSWVDSLGDAV